MAKDLNAAVEAQDPSLLTVAGYEASYEYILYDAASKRKSGVLP